MATMANAAPASKDPRFTAAPAVEAPAGDARKRASAEKGRRNLAPARIAHQKQLRRSEQRYAKVEAIIELAAKHGMEVCMELTDNGDDMKTVLKVRPHIITAHSDEPLYTPARGKNRPQATPPQKKHHFDGGNTDTREHMRTVGLSGKAPMSVKFAPMTQFPSPVPPRSHVAAQDPDAGPSKNPTSTPIPFKSFGDKVKFLKEKLPPKSPVTKKHIMDVLNAKNADVIQAAHALCSIVCKGGIVPEDQCNSAFSNIIDAYNDLVNEHNSSVQEQAEEPRVVAH